MEEGMRTQLWDEGYRYAVNYLQMLLIVCHSFPSRANLNRLAAFLTEGDRILQVRFSLKV